MSHRLLSILTLVVCLAWPSVVAAQARVSPAVANDVTRGSVRVLVRLQTVTVPEGRLSAPAINEQRSRIAAAQARVNAALGRPSSLRIFRTVPWLALELTAAQLAVLARHPSVAAIHKDELMRPSLAQSVPFIGAPVFWQNGYRGDGWTVAILDTGVESNHPMLSGRVIHEACFSTNSPMESATSLCAGGAPSGSGSGSAQPCASGITGCTHGTVIAGIAAGRSPQLSGVAPNATLAAIQVYSRINDVALCSPLATPCALSFTSDQVAGLEHVLDMAGPANAGHIAAANLSLSGSIFTSNCDGAEGMPAFKDAVDNLRAIGIPTVVASGNNGAIDAIGEPACVSTAVSVGASFGDADVISGISNRASFLSLLAPGTDVTSSVPGGGTGTFSGTSISAAFVSGSWALLRQFMPDASVNTVLNALRSTGVPVPDSTMLSYPRIRLLEAAFSAVGGAPQPPGAPQAPLVMLNGNQATFSWTPPLTGNGPTRYVVSAGSQLGAADYGSFDVGLETGISAVVGPGTYFVRVRAENPIGASASTADQSFSIAAAPPPGPPSTLIAQVIAGTVTLTWQAPNSGGLPTTYVLEAGSATGLSDLAAVDLESTTPTIVINGAPQGTYFVRVRAKNAAGLSTPSNEVTVWVF